MFSPVLTSAMIDALNRDIVGLTIDWRIGTPDIPRVRVHLSSTAYARIRDDGFRYVAQPTIHGTLYYAESAHGFTRHYVQTSTCDGMNGRVFDIPMLDGGRCTLRGPWSGSASEGRRHGYSPAVDIDLCPNDAITGVPSAMRLDALHHAISRFRPDVALIPYVLTWTVSLHPSDLFKAGDPELTPPALQEAA